MQTLFIKPIFHQAKPTLDDCEGETAWNSKRLGKVEPRSYYCKVAMLDCNNGGVDNFSEEEFRNP